MDVNEVLYYIVAFDALLILVMGVVAAAVIMLNLELNVFWQRIVPATVTIALTSIGSGVVLWIGDYMFG